MEFGGNIFCLSNTHQNGNPNNFTWDSCQQNPATSTTSKLLNAFEIPPPLPGPRYETPMPNALIFDAHRHHHPYAGDGSHLHPDPHLTCLKLGKRHYFESASVGGAAGLVLADKRGKGYSSGSGGGSPATTTVPRCQVEGCHVALLNAKDYHRRHKVCEIHSKAPKVVVLGMEQRFCQQCSRFHVVSEFDDSKRSCRRRLAGHNERRRKSSHDSLARNSTQGGCAFSLLSSRSDSWLSPSDLSTRCSAALRELIAENRAAIMARQLVSDRDWHSHNNNAVEDLKEIQPQSNYFPQQMFPQTQ